MAIVETGKSLEPIVDHTTKSLYHSSTLGSAYGILKDGYMLQGDYGTCFTRDKNYYVGGYGVIQFQFDRLALLRDYEFFRVLENGQDNEAEERTLSDVDDIMKYLVRADINPKVVSELVDLVEYADVDDVFDMYENPEDFDDEVEGTQDDDELTATVLLVSKLVELGLPVSSNLKKVVDAVLEMTDNEPYENESEGDNVEDLRSYVVNELSKFQNDCEVAKSGPIIQATYRKLAYYKNIDAQLYFDLTRGVASGTIKATSKTTDPTPIDKVRSAGIGYLAGLDGCSRTYPIGDESEAQFAIDNFIEMCNIAMDASSPITYSNGTAQVNDIDLVKKSVLNLQYIAKSKGLSPVDMITTNSVYNSLAEIDRQVLDLYDSYLGGTKVSSEVQSILSPLVNLDAELDEEPRELTSLRIKDPGYLREIYDGELFQVDSPTMDFVVVEAMDNNRDDVYAVLSKGIKDTGYSMVYTSDDYEDAVESAKRLADMSSIPSSTPGLDTDEQGVALEPSTYEGDEDEFGDSAEDYALDPSEVPSLIYHCTRGDGVVGILKSGKINSGTYMGDPKFATGVSFTTDKDYKLWDNSIFQMVLDGKGIAKKYDLVEIHEEEYNDAFEVDESELRAITPDGVDISQYLVSIELAYEGINFFNSQIRDYLPENFSVDNPDSVKDMDKDSDEYDIATALIYLNKSGHKLGTELSELIDGYKGDKSQSKPDSSEPESTPSDVNPTLINAYQLFKGYGILRSYIPGELTIDGSIGDVSIDGRLDDEGYTDLRVKINNDLGEIPADQEEMINKLDTVNEIFNGIVYFDREVNIPQLLRDIKSIIDYKPSFDDVIHKSVVDTVKSESSKLGMNVEYKPGMKNIRSSMKVEDYTIEVVADDDEARLNVFRDTKFDFEVRGSLVTKLGLSPNPSGATQIFGAQEGVVYIVAAFDLAKDTADLLGTLLNEEPTPEPTPAPVTEPVQDDTAPDDPAVEYLLSKGLVEESDDKFSIELDDHNVVIELGGTSVKCTISGADLDKTTELSVDYYRFKLSRDELIKSARYGSNRDETIKGVYSEAMEIVRLASHSGEADGPKSESDLRTIDMRVHNVSDPDEKAQLHRIVKVVKQFKDEIEADNMFNAFFLEEPKERKKYRLPTVGLGLCCYDKDIHSWGELKKSPLFKRLMKSRKIVKFRDWFRTVDPDGVKCWMYIWVDSEYAKENSEWLYESVGSMIEYEGSQYVISEVQDKSVVLKNCNEMVSIPKLELLTKILG